jgi:hypothetical protein
MKFYLNLWLCPFNNHTTKQSFLFQIVYNLEKGHTAGVTGQQGMLTPPWHLIPPLIQSEVRVLFVIFVISYYIEFHRHRKQDFCLV